MKPKSAEVQSRYRARVKKRDGDGMCPVAIQISLACFPFYIQKVRPD